MKLVKVYRHLTYILVLPTTIIALFCIVGILAALFNPGFLIPLFMMACLVVYEIASLIFLSKTITAQKATKKIIKDLITINSFFALFFCLLNIVQFTTIVFKPELVNQMLNNLAIESTRIGNATIDKAFMAKMFWIVSSVVSVYAVLMLVHIAISFKLLKEYKSYFITQD